MSQGLLPRTDPLVDIVTASFLVILPQLFLLWRRVCPSNYADHKQVPVSLTIVLLNTFIAFAVGLRMRGGIFEMVAMSPFVGA